MLTAFAIIGISCAYSQGTVLGGNAKFVIGECRQYDCRVGLSAFGLALFGEKRQF